MKLRLLLLFLLPLNIAFSQDITWLTGQEYDFEEIPQGKSVEAIFKFKNTSKEPITVELVRSACGCTIPEWSETPIKPGEIGSIKVIYNAHKIGWFYKKTKVFFVGVHRAKKLIIYGDVYE